MELFNIKDSLSNVPKKYKRVYEWDGRVFTTKESANQASLKDRVQGGCNVIVEYIRDRKKAKEYNYAGEWYEGEHWGSL